MIENSLLFFYYYYCRINLTNLEKKLGHYKKKNN